MKIVPPTGVKKSDFSYALLRMALRDRQAFLDAWRGCHDEDAEKVKDKTKAEIAAIKATMLANNLV